MLRLLLILSLLTTLPTGCVIDTFDPTTQPAITNPVVGDGEIDTYVYSESMSWAVSPWAGEIARVYPDAVLVLGHGNMLNDEWHIFPDAKVADLEFAEVYKRLEPIPVTQVVDELRAKHPGRPIVLVVCNPAGVELDRPGVVYARDNIWAIPDRALLPRSEAEPTVVGNIYEFAVTN